MIEIRRDLSVRELRFFAAVLFPAFWGLVALLLHLRAGWTAAAIIVAAVAAVIAVIGFIETRLMMRVYLAMVLTTYPIGFVISHILLGVVYYLVVTPIGFALKLAGHDPMRRALEPQAPTYWIDKPESPDTERYFRQY
jgi:hypothetical protein